MFKFFFIYIPYLKKRKRHIKATVINSGIFASAVIQCAKGRRRHHSLLTLFVDNADELSTNLDIRSYPSGPLIFLTHSRAKKHLPLENKVLRINRILPRSNIFIIYILLLLWFAKFFVTERGKGRICNTGLSTVCISLGDFLEATFSFCVYCWTTRGQEKTTK